MIHVHIVALMILFLTYGYTLVYMEFVLLTANSCVTSGLFHRTVEASCGGSISALDLYLCVLLYNRAWKLYGDSPLDTSSCYQAGSAESGDPPVT
jgi:hypothetical protein